MLEINEANKPKALINNPKTSKAFNLSKIITKYKKITKFII